MRYQLVSILSALLLCLTMLAAIVYGVGTQPALMQTLMLRTAPPEATGFPAEQYGAAAKLITDYLKGEGDFQLVFSMNGIAYNAEHEQLLIINKKEEVKHALSCLTPSFL